MRGAPRAVRAVVRVGLRNRPADGTRSGEVLTNDGEPMTRAQESRNPRECAVTLRYSRRT
jgi:hypothetical protein